MSLAAILGLGTLTWLAPTEASAQQSDEDRAADLYEEGAAAYGEERYRDAADLFAEAYQYDPNPRLAFNAARAYELAEAYAEALEYYTIARDSAGDDTDLIDLANEAIAAVEPLAPEPEPEITTAQLRVRARPDTAVVSLNGGDPVTLPLQEDLEAGDYVLVISAEGYISATENVTIVPGEDQQLSITLIEDEVIADPDPIGPVDETGGEGGFTTMQLAGLGTAGLGVLALGGGVAFYFKTASLHDDFEAGGRVDQDLADQGASAASLSTVLYAAGGLLAAGGAVLFVMGGDDGDDAESGEPEARVLFGPASVGLNIRF